MIQSLPTILCNLSDTDLYIDYDYIRYTVEAPVIATPTDYTPVITETGMRTSGDYGIRAIANIKTENQPDYSEFGFIVARKTVLGSNELSFDLEKYNGENKLVYTSGACYKVVDGNQTINNTRLDGDLTVFSAVFLRIPQNMTTDILVFRPYGKVNGSYVYGSPVEGSVKAIAERVYLTDGEYNSTYNSLESTTKEYISTILGKAVA